MFPAMYLRIPNILSQVSHCIPQNYSLHLTDYSLGAPTAKLDMVPKPRRVMVSFLGYSDATKL